MLLETSTIPAMMSHSAAVYRDRTAVEDGDVKLTYGELDELRLEVARALIALGVQPGDTVGILAPNCFEWVAAALGIQTLGAVLLPLNTRMKGSELSDILQRGEARFLFSIGDFLDIYYPDLLGDERPEQLEQVVVLRSARPGDMSWESFLAHAGEVPREVAEEHAARVSAEHTADLMFTSGTTGRPKGVMTGHGQNLKVFHYYSGVLGLQPGDRYLIVSPFFHSFGYKAGMLSALIRGATILPHQVFDAEAVLERVHRDRVHILPGPPTLYMSMLAHPRLAEYDCSSLRVAITGAAAIAPSLIQRMWSELGFEVVLTAYGLTEACGCSTICQPEDDAETIAHTSGRALPGMELRVVDSQGNPLPAGEAGEIVIRGYGVMQGYLNDPDATSEAIDADGWLHTGDIGTLDERGYLRITDRLKDMFIVGGFNCYPAEIERLLVAHPAIAQVAVIGVPDERMGEVGKAFVVLREDSSAEPEQLQRWAREHMANYKVPRYFEIVSSLPTNASGKVVRYQLRDSQSA